MNGEATIPSHEGTATPRRRPALSRVGLGMLAMLHLLVAVSFLIVLALASGRAHAEDAATQEAAGQQAAVSKSVCKGTDLLSQTAHTDPARLAKIREEAAAVPNGENRLWKITGKSNAPSWLYGTMHVSDPRVLALPVPAENALSKAATVVIETTAVLDPTKAQAQILAKPGLTMFIDGTTLADHLDAADLELVKSKLKQRGISFDLVSRMKPWMLATMVAIPECEAAGLSAGKDYLDKKIAEDAEAKGKAVKGLETADEQLEAMAGLPMKFHIRSLVEALKSKTLMDNIAVTMTDLYLEGEIGTIEPMLQAFSPGADGASDPDYAAFQKRIITDRNAVMVRRAAPIIANGNAFIAIGALHLPGKKGVVALLREAGYTVTAIH